MKNSMYLSSYPVTRLSAWLVTWFAWCDLSRFKLSLSMFSERFSMQNDVETDVVDVGTEKWFSYCCWVSALVAASHGRSRRSPLTLQISENFAWKFSTENLSEFLDRKFDRKMDEKFNRKFCGKFCMKNSVEKFEWKNWMKTCLKN